MKKILPLFLALSLYAPGGAGAQIGGIVTSRPCPYNCLSAGIPRPWCRDWANGGMCYVEDLRNLGGTYNPPPVVNPPVVTGGYVMDTDGICCKAGEIPNPNIDYTRGGYRNPPAVVNPPVVTGGYVMDTDGKCCKPGEIPNPNINYGTGRRYR